MCDDDLLYNDRIVHMPPRIAYRLRCIRWVNISKHGLPKKNLYYLVTYKMGNEKIVQEAWFSTFTKKFSIAPSGYVPITHWAHMPSPPDEAEEVDI